MENVKKMVRLLLILLWFQNESLATYKVFKFNKTTNDAELHCEGKTGKLLGYGTDLFVAARFCGVTDVLTNRPWFQNFGCFQMMSSTVEYTINKNQLANCATFCAKDSYIFIGVQESKCLCYTSLVGASPAVGCDVPCPGNSMEKCGVDQKHMIVYRKVTTLQSSDCQYVDLSEGKIQMLASDCNTARNFICKVGNSTHIECLNENGQTDPPAPTTEKGAKSLVDESNSNLGVILGVMIAVFVLAAVVVAVVLVYRLRKRKKANDDKHRIHPSPATKRQESNNDFINAYRVPADFNNINLHLRDPVPIVAFGGEGVDLDKETPTVPVYTAVHKTSNTGQSSNSTSDITKTEPAYDEVYQPSNVVKEQPYKNVKNPVNDKSSPDLTEQTTNFGSYAGIKKGRQRREQNDTNNYASHGHLDDDLY